MAILLPELEEQFGETEDLIQKKTDGIWQLNLKVKEKNKHFELEIIMKHIKAGHFASLPL